MIDWGYVAANGLWITGLALLLANLSYHDWLADRLGLRLRDLLASPSHVFISSFGLALFSLGLFFLRLSALEKLGWAIVGAFFALVAARSLIKVFK